MKMDISKGSIKAITRFDKMHMGISAFSCKEDCQKDMGMFCYSSETIKWTMTINQNSYFQNSEKLCLCMTQPLWFCLGSHTVRAKRRRLRVSQDCCLDFRESENHYRVDSGQSRKDFLEKKMQFKIALSVTFPFKLRTFGHLPKRNAKYLLVTASQMCFWSCYVEYKQNCDGHFFSHFLTFTDLAMNQLDQLVSDLLPDTLRAARSSTVLTSNLYIDIITRYTQILSLIPDLL